jgi:hypothetical protein
MEATTLRPVKKGRLVGTSGFDMEYISANLTGIDTVQS